MSRVHSVYSESNARVELPFFYGIICVRMSMVDVSESVDLSIMDFD